MVLEVTPVIVPATCPEIASVSSSGTENSVGRFEEPVPALIPTVTNPTGSVVAVSWALAPNGRDNPETIEVTREIRRRFIQT